MKPERDLLSILCAAIVFGSVASPLLLIALGVLRNFNPALGFAALPALAVSTGLLFAVFVRESRAESAMRRRIGKAFPPLLGVLLGCCLFVNLALLGVLANFTLLSWLEYWFGLIAAVSVSALAAVIAVPILQASRLEKALSARLGKGRGANPLLRSCAVALLALAAVGACWIAYRFHAAPTAFPR